MTLTIEIRDTNGQSRARISATDEAVLVFRDSYQPGDSIILTTDQPNAHLIVSLDDALPPVPVYLADGTYALPIPFDLVKRAYSPKTFSGDMHRITARLALPHEFSAYRNLALNPYDHSSNASLFPHCEATIITRNEAAFAARNAIDGETANADHGFWPYTSWGINRDPDAALTIHFGRPVEIDMIGLYLRADFPHDAWWEQASVSFPDGHTERFSLGKTEKAQRFAIAPRKTEWLRLHDLIKADDPSPFPALTQIEAWGRDLVR